MAINKEDLLKTAAICGLFCKSCTCYIGTKEDGKRLELLSQRSGRPTEDFICDGCRTKRASYYCRDCYIKNCVKQKSISFCFECSEYPCVHIKEFKEQMPHRIELFDSLQYLKENGIDKWEEKMQSDYSCPDCGATNSAYDIKCRKCGAYPGSEYAKRHGEQIINKLKK